MPVFLEDHDPDIALRPGTTKSDIVAYLYRNPEWGYSPQEITETLDIPRGTATTTLKRLYDDGYVGKTEDGYYHALSDRKDVRRYVSSLDQAHRMFGHHRDADATPEEPEKRIGEDRTDEELDAELAELEADVGDVDE
jgi:DNA-binding MarR family transcriptional regulator